MLIPNHQSCLDVRLAFVGCSPCSLKLFRRRFHVKGNVVVFEEVLKLLDREVTQVEETVSRMMGVEA